MSTYRSLDDFRRAHGFELESAKSHQGWSLSVPGTYRSEELLELATRTVPSFDTFSNETIERARALGDHLYVMTRERQYSAEDFDLKSLLANLGVRCHAIGSLFDVQFKAQQPPGVPALDPPYGFKGGVARLALAQILGISDPIPLRDFDLISMGPPNSEKDRAMSEQYMGKDYGVNPKHGVELVRSPRDHLRNRDLTMNELYLYQGTLTSTYQALFDSIGGVIRPSAVIFKSAGNGMPSNIAAKALRIFSEKTATGQSVELRYFLLKDDSEIRPFDVALNLAKALNRSPLVAELFLASLELSRSFQSLQGCDSVEDAVRLLCRAEPRAHAVFTNHAT